MNLKRARLLILPTLLVFTSLSAHGSEATSVDSYLTPTAILQEIKLKGAREVVSDLYGHPQTWRSVLERIASGDQSWLEVAVALHPGLDAGSSEMLNLAVGAALENNPVNVFQITLKAFQLKSICSGPDVDDPKYNSYELSMKAIDLRIRQASSIKDQSLTKISKSCIQYLEESKKGIAHFYQMKSK